MSTERRTGLPKPKLMGACRGMRVDEPLWRGVGDYAD
jgi:hypothetical protein